MRPRFLRRHKPAPDTFDEAQAVTREIHRFKTHGLDYESARLHLDQVLISLGKSRYSEDTGAASIHWVLFAALSLVSTPRRLLEIGTYDGETTLLLSRLFPDANITTLDLPHDDPRFIELYGRYDPLERQAFIDTQRRNTAEPNIELLLTDSLMLPTLVKPGYDLIWVDGGHNYPVVAWDIANAIHLCAPGGLILCDDILIHPDAGSFNFVSTHAYEVTEYVRAHTALSVDYFLKRHASRWSAKAKRRKYVAFMKKPD